MWGSRIVHNGQPAFEQLEPRLLLSAPPYVDADAYHTTTDPDTVGWAHAHSESVINPTAGLIHHNAWADSKVAGSGGIAVLDAIYSDFSVPVSGSYDVTFRGSLSGGVWNVSSSLKLGAAMGGGKLWLESRITQFRESEVQETLYETDLSTGALLETLGQSALWGLLGIGDFVAAIDTLKGLFGPVASWEPGTDHFEHTSSVHLQAEQSYRWSSHVMSSIASASLGGACNVSMFDLNVSLEGVEVVLTSSVPDSTPPVVTLNGGFSSEPGSPSTRNSSFTANASAIDPESGILSDSYHFVTWKKSGVSWGVGTDWGACDGTDGIGPFSDGLYRIEASAKNGAGLTSYSGYGYFQVSGGPGEGSALLMSLSMNWDDKDPCDGDGYPEPEEGAGVEIKLTHNRGTDVSGIEATLSSSLGSVDITDPTVTYPLLPPGGSSWANDDYDMDFNFGSDTDVPFTLYVTYMQDGTEYYQSWDFTERIEFVDASFVPDYGLTWYDDVHPGDGERTTDALDSGEGADLYLYISNTGTADATDVEVMLADVPEFRIDEEWILYPDLSAGGSALPPSGGHYFTIRDVPMDVYGVFPTTATVRYGDGTIEETIPMQIVVTPSPYMRATWSENGSDQLDFGVVAPGDPVSKNFEIRNNGTDTLTVSSVTPSHPGDTSVMGPSRPVDISPEETVVFTVGINTTGMNATISRNIEIVSNGHSAPPGYGTNQTLRITGTVTDVTPGTYEQLFEINRDDLVCVDAGDTDGDGWREIIALVEDSNPKVFIYEQAGDDQYVERWNTGSTLAGDIWDKSRILSVADVNGDGKDDIVLGITDLGAGAGELILIESSADDSWSSTWTSGTGFGRIHDVATGDSDNDGQMEIVFFSIIGTDKTVRILENNGGTSFSHTYSVPQIFETGGSPYESLGGITVADSDKDGHSEILFTSGNRGYEYKTNDDQFFIYESTGNNSYVQRFAGMSYNDDGVQPWRFAPLAVGDPDADGLNEIILIEEHEQSLWIIESPSNDQWLTDPTESEYRFFDPNGRDPLDVAMSDLDSDGRTEIVVTWDQPMVPGVRIFEAFGPDSYVVEWEEDTLFDREAYSIAIDETNSSGNPSVILGIDANSDVRPEIRVLGVSLPLDLSITEAGIIFAPTFPVEDEAVTVTATVWNLGSGDAQNVAVRFYEGDPALGNQIDGDQVIPVLPGGESGTVQVTWSAVTEGSYEICVVVDPDNAIQETEEGNSQACRSIVVEDDDREGPMIQNVLVAEYNGDGQDGIGADEEIQISWDLLDSSGIGSTQLWVDLDGDGLGTPGARDPDDEVTVDGGYYAVLEPVEHPGEYEFAIDATDGDNTPLSSQYNAAFDVVAAEEITILYDGQPLVDGVSEVDFGQITQCGTGIPKVFIVRNDGQQALALGSLSVPAGFTKTDPLAAVLLEGASTHFTVTLDTPAVGAFGGDVSLANSDGPRSPDGLDESPFDIAVVGTVLPIMGDANGDGVVDGGDYTLWADNYKQPGGWGEGDFSGNGFVDGGDYTLWADNYAPAGGAAAGLAAAAYDAGDTSDGAPAGVVALVAGPRGRSTPGTVPSLSGWAGAGAGRGRVMRLVDKLIGATMAAGAKQEAEQSPDGSGGRKASQLSAYARLGRKLPGLEAELNLLQDPDLTVLAAAI